MENSLPSILDKAIGIQSAVRAARAMLSSVVNRASVFVFGLAL